MENKIIIKHEVECVYLKTRVLLRLCRLCRYYRHETVDGLVICDYIIPPDKKDHALYKRKS